MSPWLGRLGNSSPHYDVKFDLILILIWLLILMPARKVSHGASQKNNKQNKQREARTKEKKRRVKRRVTSKILKEKVWLKEKALTKSRVAFELLTFGGKPLSGFVNNHRQVLSFQRIVIFKTLRWKIEDPECSQRWNISQRQRFRCQLPQSTSMMQKTGDSKSNFQHEKGYLPIQTL